MFTYSNEIIIIINLGDQAWKFGHHWVKAGRIGDPMGLNVEPCYASPGNHDSFCSMWLA